MGLSAPKQMEQGDQLKPKDIVGHTLILGPIEYIPSIKTEYDKGDDTSQAIKCNVADFAEDPQNPTIYRGVLFFNVSLYNNLRKQIGEFIAGRIYQGQAKPGQSAPWLLQDVTLEPEWMAFLGSWLDHTPEGQGFQAETVEAIRDASNLSAPATTPPAANPTAPPAPPAPAPVAARPPAVAAPPAPTPVAVPAPAAQFAQAAVAPATVPAAVAIPALAPAAVAPAGNGMDYMAMIAGLPPEEQAKMIAIMQNQGNAAS
jgi:hypothetical protein